MYPNRILTGVVLLGTLAGVTQVTSAQDHTAALADYLADDVVGVIYVDLSKIDVLGYAEWAIQLGFVPDDQRQAAMDEALKVQGQLDELVDFGAPRIYVLLWLTEVGQRWPAWVVPIADGDNAGAVKALLTSGAPAANQGEAGGRPEFFPTIFETVDGAVLGASDVEQMKLLKETRLSQPRDLAEAWEALGQGAGGVILFGNQDSRRVLREMFPQLPPPFDGIDGRLITDGARWGGVSVRTPPEPRLEIVLEASSDEAARTFEQAINQLLLVARAVPLPPNTIPEEGRAALLDALVPKVDGTRLLVAPTDLLQNAERMTMLLAPAVRQMQQDAQRHARMNQFKEICLAILNYEDSKKILPFGAPEFRDGKPLLSWRVLILPYLDQKGLYDQFHLDEAWDSEHNKQLIAKMPAVYADPDPALRALNAAGKTTYIVPHGPETVNPGQEPNTLKNVTDGLSNTIVILEVSPDKAEIWTKPSEEEFDMFHPWVIVRRDNRNWFAAGFVDGHVSIFDENSVPAEKLRALLTRAGGEVIEW